MDWLTIINNKNKTYLGIFLVSHHSTNGEKDLRRCVKCTYLFPTSKKLEMIRERERKEKNKEGKLYIGEYTTILFNRIPSNPILHSGCHHFDEDYSRMFAVVDCLKTYILHCWYYLHLMWHDRWDMFHAKQIRISNDFRDKRNSLQVEANVIYNLHENGGNREDVWRHHFLWNHPCK